MQPFAMIGRTLIYIGIVLIIVGLIVLYGEKINFFGKLPGDFIIKRENFTFYFPLTTSIIISIILTIVFYIIRKLG